VNAIRPKPSNVKDFEDILSLKFWAQNPKQVSGVKLLRNSQSMEALNQGKSLVLS